jgi:hypothetical protein
LVIAAWSGEGGSAGDGLFAWLFAEAQPAADARRAIAKQPFAQTRRRLSVIDKRLNTAEDERKDFLKSEKVLVYARGQAEGNRYFPKM